MSYVGDQIGQLFAYLGNFLLSAFFENYRSSLNFPAAVFHGKSFAVLLTKNVLGDIFGDFFTNSSGHPAQSEARRQRGANPFKLIHLLYRFTSSNQFYFNLLEQKFRNKFVLHLPFRTLAE
jgi:hypothetical protein